MYPAFMKIAEMQGEKDALRSFDWSYQTEKMHLALFQKAQAAVPPAGRGAGPGAGVRGLRLHAGGRGARRMPGVRGQEGEVHGLLVSRATSSATVSISTQ